MHMSAAKVTGLPESETKTFSPFLKACTEITEVKASGLKADIRPSSHVIGGVALFAIGKKPEAQAVNNMRPPTTHPNRAARTWYLVGFSLNCCTWVFEILELA
jgi:hypothetical protein